MKKICGISIVVLVTCLGSLPCHSQEAIRGRNNVTAGYGFLPIEIRSNEVNSGNSFSRSYTGPFYFKYEHFFEYNLSLGISYAHAEYGFEYDVKYSEYINNVWIDKSFRQKERHVSQSFLARMNYHMLDYQEKFKWDPFVGIGLGYRQTNYELENNYNGSNNYSYYGYHDPYMFDWNFGMEITFGVRCYLTPAFAIYAEGGMAKSAFQAGTTFSF